MKNHKKCVIIFISLLIACYLAIDITKALKGEKLIFFERWRLSNKEYAKNIEVKSYLLTDEQAAELLANPQKEITQPMQKELYMKNLNVVLRLKNKKGIYAWGTLAFSYKSQNWSYIDIAFTKSVDYEKSYYNFIIPNGILIISNKPKCLTIFLPSFMIISAKVKSTFGSCGS